MLVLPTDIVAELHAAPFSAIVDLWELIISEYGNEGKAALGRCDRFYLLTNLLHRPDAFHPWLYQRCREVEQEPDGCLDLWAREHYKDLADDTPVLTANRGWIRHGELVVGDSVFSPDGNAVAVIAISPGYSDSECYLVTLSDGESVVAGAGHLWRLRVKSRFRQPGTEKRRVEFTHKIVSTGYLAAKCQGDRIDIGSCAPLQYEDQSYDLPIKPYLLGCWLGDGEARGTRITCAYSDSEIIDRIVESGYAVCENKTASETTGLYRIGSGRRGVKGTGLSVDLRRLGVFGNKHIPKSYLRSSIAERMELLRGLMDTDGHCNNRGTATFVQKNEVLARDVYDLVVSLGMQPRIRKYSNNYGYFYQVSFQAYQDLNPFHLKRKASRAKSGDGYRASRYISKVERCDTVPTRCIQVEGGMYVAGRSLIPTHNSTIITFTGIIQEIIKDKEITIGLFSHSKKPAKKFLLMIKTELENNDELKALYPDVFWQDPDRDAPAAGRQWNSDRIDVNRETNPREGTLECSGLVDGQPTGSHFRLRVYDDVVTRESVTSSEMIEKTTSAWELSDNLGARGEDGKSRAWHIGTRYHFADTYHHILDKKLLKPRVYPATDTGLIDGKPVFLSPAVLKEKIAIQGSNFPAQMLQNPAAGQNATFQKDWLRFTDIRPGTVNIYIMGDPASSKKKGSDSTAIPVIAIDANLNKYLVDGMCHKMNLRERWLAIRELRRKWRSQPGVQSVEVGYEKYGMQSDLDYFTEQMEADQDVFSIRELNWTRDGTTSKEDRVQRLVPDFLKGKFYLPLESPGETSNQKRMRESGQGYRVLVPAKRKDHEGNLYSLNKQFLDEFLFFPFAVHDDLIDACSRVYDMEYQAPVIIEQAMCEPEVE